MSGVIIRNVISALVLTSISPFDVILDPQKSLEDPELSRQLWTFDCSFESQCKIYNNFYNYTMGVLVGPGDKPGDYSIVQLVNGLNPDSDKWVITENDEIILGGTDLAIDVVHGNSKNKQLWLYSKSNNSPNNKFTLVDVKNVKQEK